VAGTPAFSCPGVSGSAGELVLDGNDASSIFFAQPLHAKSNAAASRNAIFRFMQFLRIKALSLLYSISPGLSANRGKLTKGP